jgi:hypothetical protein
MFRYTVNTLCYYQVHVVTCIAATVEVHLHHSVSVTTGSTCMIHCLSYCCTHTQPTIQLLTAQPMHIACCFCSKLYRVLVSVAGIICAVPMNVVPAAHLSYSIEYRQGVAPTLDHFFKWYAGLLFLVILALGLQG